jgi:NADH-quinone oxidoreductase subunit C
MSVRQPSRLVPTPDHGRQDMTETNLTVKKLREKFLNSILEVKTFRNEVTVSIPKKDLLEICRFLHSEPDLQYHLLTDLCGSDHFQQTPRFEVVYHLCSVKNNQRLRLKTSVGEFESVKSVESVWRVANWYEREAYDLLGISFEGHSDLRRIMLWDGYEGHPLRKDFPVEGPDFDKPFVPEV